MLGCGVAYLFCPVGPIIYNRAAESIYVQDEYREVYGKEDETVQFDEPEVPK